MKKLSDMVTGGIYEYYRTDNDEVVYRGSSEKRLNVLNEMHRKGETFPAFKNKYKYNYTVFRTNLTRPIGEKLEARWVAKPKKMTREELLSLEGDMINEKIDEGQCYLNHTPDPLKSWKKYN